MNPWKRRFLLETIIFNGISPCSIRKYIDSIRVHFPASYLSWSRSVSLKNISYPGILRILGFNLAPQFRIWKYESSSAPFIAPPSITGIVRAEGCINVFGWRKVSRLLTCESHHISAITNAPKTNDHHTWSPPTMGHQTPATSKKKQKKNLTPKSQMLHVMYMEYLHTFTINWSFT